jgi:hypothetical protein
MNVFVLCFVDARNKVWFLEKRGDLFRLTNELEDALGFYTRDKAERLLQDLLEHNEEYNNFFSKLEVKDFFYYENKTALTH